MSYEIYNEDCLEGMKRIPDGSVDLIVTDPPYCVGATSNGTKSSFSDFNLLRPFFEQLFEGWQRVLKTDGQIYVNTDWRTYPFLYPITQKIFLVRNLIVWDYQWLKMGNWYRHAHEFIIFATNGNVKRTFSASETDVWKIRCVTNTGGREKFHPAEKPIELCERMIKNSSSEGGTVLDCFMGSGTTGVAAVNTDRNFIGFELEQKFFDIAQNRIQKAVNERQQRLF